MPARRVKTLGGGGVVQDAGKHYHQDARNSEVISAR